jgi:triosephosphate isomerase
MKKKFIIVANWKMYPRTAREAKASFLELTKKARFSGHVEIVIAPPSPYLAFFRKNKTMSLGAQDIFYEPEGAFTGEISGPMIKSLGAGYVIIGHSERRKFAGESDLTVNKKLKHTLKSGLRPILCVGETDRDADGIFFGVLKKQIESAFAKVKSSDARRVIVAYEPVWAIGTGKPARPRDANEAALFIKKVLAARYDVSFAKKIQILYGGSVDAKVAESFLREQEISGLLVGGASRNPRTFLNIVQCATSIS